MEQAAKTPQFPSRRFSRERHRANPGVQPDPRSDFVAVAAKPRARRSTSLHRMAQRDHGTDGAQLPPQSISSAIWVTQEQAEVNRTTKAGCAQV